MSASRKILVASLVALLSGTAIAADAPAADTGHPAVSLKTEKDRISYSVGVSTGRALRTADGAEVDFESLVQGLRDGLEGNHLALSEKQMNELMGRFQQTLRQKMMASRGRAIAENRMAAEKFFAENKGKPGVFSLSSGVQYKIFRQGEGALPTEGDVVTCNYRGTTLNGHEFDATEPGHPAALKVAALIPGWKEALKLMPVGSHWTLYIPPQLAYGERGVGTDIGPNEALVFDVELLDSKLALDKE